MRKRNERQPLIVSNIALIGMMGAGKTTLGKAAAQALGCSFYDVDAVIEASSGMTVTDIFTQYGEEEFRRRERASIKQLTSGTGYALLATGGGAYCQDETRALLTAACVTVFLHVPEELLLARLARSNRAARPLLRLPDWQARVRELIRVRYPIYQQATHILEIGDETTAASTQRLIALIAPLQK